jgi:hypothetical protein
MVLRSISFGMRNTAVVMAMSAPKMRMMTSCVDLKMVPCSRAVK